MEAPTVKMDGFKWLAEERGLQLIKVQRRGKAPVKGEKVARTEKRLFEDVKLTRNDNAGVLTGKLSQIIVLDIDDSTLFPSEYEIPDTFTVKTGKGFHHYYRLPADGKSYGNRAIKAEGFDIRGDGGYVVAPWSRHPDDITYTILSDCEFAAAPQWLLDLAESTSAAKVQSTVKVPVVINVTKPSGFKFPQMNIKVIEGKVARGKRSEQVWRVLHELVEHGCKAEDILYIFETHPAGIGVKYFEKGAGRVNWLVDQIGKVQKEYADWYTDPVQAKDQTAVGKLTQAITTTFEGYGLSVSQSQ